MNKHLCSGCGAALRSRLMEWQRSGINKKQWVSKVKQQYSSGMDRKQSGGHVKR